MRYLPIILFLSLLCTKSLQAELWKCPGNSYTSSQNPQGTCELVSSSSACLHNGARVISAGKLVNGTDGKHCQTQEVSFDEKRAYRHKFNKTSRTVARDNGSGSWLDQKLSPSNMDKYKDMSRKEVANHMGKDPWAREAWLQKVNKEMAPSMSSQQLIDEATRMQRPR